MAQQVCPGIKIIYLKECEVENNINLLNQVALCVVRTLNGFRKVHHMEISNIISFRLLHLIKYLWITLVVAFSLI